MRHLLSLLLATSLLPAQASFGKDSPWKALALDDLNAIKTIIQENHPGLIDAKNPYFKQWFEKSYKEAYQLASKASSFEEFVVLPKRFINGFKDGHLNHNLTIERRDLLWPGFIVALRGEKFVVHTSSPKASFARLPAKGEELLACDGKPVRVLMRENVFPFSGNEDLPAHWTLFTPHLFLDQRNPYIKRPASCDFSKSGNVTLSWQPTRKSELTAALEHAAFGPLLEFSVREVQPGVHWFTLPTFEVSGDHVGAMQAAIAKVSALRHSRAIIFDVRGNSGGSSEWGAQLTEKLYGDDTLAFIEMKLQRDQYVEYRVSPGNIKHFEWMIPYLEAQSGKESRVVKYFAGVTAGMKASAKNQQPFFKTSADYEEASLHVQTMPKSRVTAKVVLLTDGHCGSACLDFADLLLAIPGVLHVGSATSADTDYMEVRGLSLPSGIARLSFATKVYRNRPRAHNQYYTPQHVWDGDMGDTPGLESWMLKLLPASQEQGQ